MPTFVNTIDNNEILAKRSQCDYAGNDIQTTYATKSEIVNADWDAVSGAPGYIENKPVIPEGVPTYTAAEEGKVLGVVEVSGSPALDWVQGGGGDSTLPSYYDRVEQKTLDGSMASIVLGPMLTRQTQTNTFNQRALAYTTLNSILLYGRGYAGMWLMDFVDRGYVHLSRSGVWADNPTYAIWFPCTANSSNILTPINTSVYLKTKSTYIWSYAGNYSHYVYTSTGSALTWSLARDARFPAPFSATGEIDTTLFDQVGDWSNITMPEPWQWALAFQDSDGNFTNCGGDSSENYTGLSVAYPVSYYNVKLMPDGGLAENRGAGLYVTNPLPSSTSSDENKVLTVNSSGSPEWATPSGGGSVTDVEVNGTSVVNASGVAEVTVPSGAQLVPAATSADADKVLTVDGQGIPGWAVVPSQSTGLFQAEYGTTSYADIVQAINDKKIVYCRLNSGASRMAFLAYIGSSNVEFQYYRSLSSHSASNMTDEVYVYTVSSSGWTTTTRKTGVKVMAGTHMSQSYSNDTLTLDCTWPTVDQTYDASSTNAQSGVAVASAIAGVNAVPASTSSDADKVLTVDAQGTPGWAAVSLGDVNNVIQVNALPATTDPSTLYLIPET